jgi:hypothetical protein
MKHWIIIASMILAIGITCGFILRSQDPSRRVVVMRLDVDFPDGERQREDFLAGYLPDNDGPSSLATTCNWRQKYERYSAALLIKAASGGFDSRSLSNVLQVVLADSNRVCDAAYLPVGAYETRLHNEPVWIVSLRWEVDSPEPERLGHIRAYAFTARDVKEVGFVTCR